MHVAITNKNKYAFQKDAYRLPVDRQSSGRGRGGAGVHPPEVFHPLEGLHPKWGGGASRGVDALNEGFGLRLGFVGIFKEIKHISSQIFPT